MRITCKMFFVTAFSDHIGNGNISIAILRLLYKVEYNRYSAGGGLNLRDTLSSQAACWCLICVRTVCQAERVIGCR